MVRSRRIAFPAWIESTVRLPLGLAATPGKITLAPYWREVANAMVDPRVEKITIVKSAQVGFSTLLSSLIGWHLTAKPAPILVVLPAELDARNYIVSLEDIFHCSPALQDKLPTPSTAGRDEAAQASAAGHGAGLETPAPQGFSGPMRPTPAAEKLREE